ncbi:MAG: RNA polymerase sigma factor [Bacteroidales bacterium]|jgi:RNA polymerase sigma-70 factor (ECF subfamily)
MSKIVREEGFLSVINQHRRIIHKIVVLYTDNDCDKEDLFQEIIFQCWRSYPSFRNESKVSTWIYKVSLNTALVFRKKNRKKATPQTEEAISQQYADQLSVAPVNENLLQSALITAIKSFGKTDRMIITLHLDGYGNTEIAHMMGISVGNTAVKLHRIKEQLKSILKEDK